VPAIMPQRGQDDPLPKPPVYHRRSFDEELLKREASGPQLLYDRQVQSTTTNINTNTTTRNERHFYIPKKSPSPTAGVVVLVVAAQEDAKKQASSSNRSDPEEPARSKSLKKTPPPVDERKQQQQQQQQREQQKQKHKRGEEDKTARTHRSARRRTRAGDDDPDAYDSQKEEEEEDAPSDFEEDEGLFPGATKISGKHSRPPGRPSEFDNLIVGDGGGSSEKRIDTEQQVVLLLTAPQTGDIASAIRTTATSEEVSVVVAHLAPDEEEIAKEIDERVNEEVAKRLQQQKQQEQQQQQQPLSEQQQQQLRPVPEQQPNSVAIVAEAVKVEDLPTIRRRTLLRNGMRAAIMISVIVVVIVSIVIGRSSTSANTNTDDTPNSSPTASPTTSFTTRFDELYDLIGADVSETPELVLRDRSTPQHDAMAWMADEDDANLDFARSSVVPKQRLIERYVLALFYLEMGGDDNTIESSSSWIVDYSFLSPLPVCGWTEENGGFDRGVLCVGSNVTELRFRKYHKFACLSVSFSTSNF
jgi:hypothetical protein